jgi:hypothetical protein
MIGGLWTDDESFDGYELGDSVEASCPHCGEPVTILVDPGGGSRQEYVEDCSVCCRPWMVRVWVAGDGVASVELRPSD